MNSNFFTTFYKVLYYLFPTHHLSDQVTFYSLSCSVGSSHINFLLFLTHVSHILNCEVLPPDLSVFLWDVCVAYSLISFKCLPSSLVIFSVTPFLTIRFKIAVPLSTFPKLAPWFKFLHSTYLHLAFYIHVSICLFYVYPLDSSLGCKFHEHMDSCQFCPKTLPGK